MYEDFLKTGGNWKKGLVWREVVRRHRGLSKGVRKWLTKEQLINHFEGDEQVANAIIKRKTEIPDLRKEVRDHPELPGHILRLSTITYQVHIHDSRCSAKISSM